MDNGWIKLHRSILDWEWYDDRNTFKVFMHLLLTANHKDKRYRGKNIKRGCLVTGRELLAKRLGISVMQLRTSLSKLKSTNEITIKTSSQGTEIEIVNYNKYQLVTSEITKEQPASNQQVTTNKNVKKEKNEKKYSERDLFLAELLFEFILQRNSQHKKPNMDNWANDIRLMIQQDKRTYEDAEILIRWSQQDDFWKNNILSPNKLRKQFDKLILKAKEDVKHHTQRPTAHSDSRI